MYSQQFSIAQPFPFSRPYEIQISGSCEITNWDATTEGTARAHSFSLAQSDAADGGSFPGLSCTLLPGVSLMGAVSSSAAARIPLITFLLESKGSRIEKSVFDDC